MDYRKKLLRYVKIHLAISQLTFLKELTQEVMGQNASDAIISLGTYLLRSD